jgi:DNA-binding response OmpR family regulator
MARILVVDDEDAICSLLKMVLSKYDVVTCKTGLQMQISLELEKFDLIISDICLPIIPGPEAYRLSKSTTPIIYMSGDLPMEYRDLTVLMKPFGISDLLRIVDRVLAD